MFKPLWGGESNGTDMRKQESETFPWNLLRIYYGLNPIVAQMGFPVQFNFTPICSSEAKFNYIDQLPMK